MGDASVLTSLNGCLKCSYIAHFIWKTSYDWSKGWHVTWDLKLHQSKKRKAI